VSERRDVFEAVRDLRPQSYGDRPPDRIMDPVVEPVWTGVRVLAAATPGSAVLHDPKGERYEARPEIPAALGGAVLAESIIVDGYLTKEVAHTDEESAAYTGPAPMPSMPKLIGQSLFGTRRNRAKEAAEMMERVREATTFRNGEVVSLVATDLLWLDGEELFDVPLLERKRLLEAALAESDLIRRGTFVRPPIARWMGSWRSLGFTAVSFRAANSRYRPGERAADWTTAPIPRR
jgi:hypothetical protein